MDTHFEHGMPHQATHPELSLPGEIDPVKPADIQSVSVEEPAPSPAADGADDTDLSNPSHDTGGTTSKLPSSNRRRSRLMTGVAIGAVAIVAAGVFLISPYNHIIPVDMAAYMAPSPMSAGTEQTINIPAPIAPAADLARAKSPEPAPPHPPVLASRPGSRVDPQNSELDFDELLNIRPGSNQQAKARSDHSPKAGVDQDEKPLPVQSASTPAAIAPHTAEAIPSPPAAPPAPAAPPVLPVSSPVVLPPIIAPQATDPASTAAVLQAAPLSSPQQIEVLGVVTELGVLIRNQRIENAQLKADVAQMRSRLDSQLGDYDRRLSLAEARGAISAAMGAGSSPSPSTAATPIQTTSVTPTLVVTPANHQIKAGTTPSPTPSETARRYRVQAASPGLAMLAEVDRAGDVGNLLQVSIGDDVPGYGKVKSITQQGAAWVLTAERGTIR